MEEARTLTKFSLRDWFGGNSGLEFEWITKTEFKEF